jgi:hypothetical protein
MKESRILVSLIVVLWLSQKKFIAFLAQTQIHICCLKGKEEEDEIKETERAAGACGVNLQQLTCVHQCTYEKETVKEDEDPQLSDAALIICEKIAVVRQVFMGTATNMMMTKRGFEKFVVNCHVKIFKFV